MIIFFFFFQLVEFAQKYGVSISENDLSEFQEYLIKHPMLGTKHIVGDKLYEAVRLHKEAGEGLILGRTSVESNNTYLFRGRNRKIDSEAPYKKTEMWAPKAGYSSHGRYNAIGIPVLYLSDNKYALPYELHTADDEFIDIVTFKLERNLLVFDIHLFGLEFESFFSNTRIDSRQLKYTYLLPNFFAACCHLHEFDGVKYSGVRGEKLSYNNYALFNYKNELDVSITGDLVTYKQIIERKLEL